MEVFTNLEVLGTRELEECEEVIFLYSSFYHQFK